MRSLRKKLGQTTTEYMLVVSVMSIAAMFTLAYFADPRSPPQKAAKSVSDNFEKGLVNGDGRTMRVE